MDDSVWKETESWNLWVVHAQLKDTIYTQKILENPCGGYASGPAGGEGAMNVIVNDWKYETK